MVAPESKMPKTVFCTVVLEVSSLQLNVKLFNVGRGHRHHQRPTSVVFLRSYHGVGLGGLLIVIRVAAGGEFTTTSAWLAATWWLVAVAAARLLRASAAAPAWALLA